jgi:hypothetical protein
MVFARQGRGVFGRRQGTGRARVDRHTVYKPGHGRYASYTGLDSVAAFRGALTLCYSCQVFVQR